MSNDAVGSMDQVSAGLSRAVVAVEHPCPLCGKGMKDANTKATKDAGLDVRVCSNRLCREKRDWSTGTGSLFVEPSEPVVSEVVAPMPGAPTFVGPEHPCPDCGKAMKDANTTETRESGQDVRICSSRLCRQRADWATGSAVRL